MEVVRDDSPGDVVDRSGSLEQVVSPLEIDWADPRVTRISFIFTNETFVDEFLEKFLILKADASRDFFRVEPCSATETIFLIRSPTKSFFFYMYACLFSDLHVSLPFDNFTMDVLKALNVAPTQLHPNTWASIQAFHPSKPVMWRSLISRSGNILLSPFTASYKRFKEQFFKVFVFPSAMPYFFDETGQSRFLMSWTMKPLKFKEWPRPAKSVEELEILPLIDGLPRKLPFPRGNS